MLGIKLKRDMTRGDTFPLPIKVIINNTQYMFSSADTVIFRLWDPYTKETIMQKSCSVWDDGIAHIQLEPADTINLDFMIYKYEVEWTNPEGRRLTIIEDSIFEIHPEGKVLS